MIFHEDIEIMLDSGSIDQIKTRVPPSMINQPIGEDGSALIHYAAASGNTELLRYCIENGADCDKETTRGTPLIYAILSESEECVRRILSRNVNLEARDHSNMTPLMIASGGSTSLWQSKKGAPFDYYPDRESRFWAFKRKTETELEEEFILRNTSPDDPEVSSPNKRWRLYYRFSGNPEYDSIESRALEKVNSETRRSHNFQCKTCQTHVEIVSLLIKAGANLNPQANDKCGRGFMSSPLNCAILSGHMDVAKLLIKEGALVNKGNKDEEPPICVAARSEDFDAVKTLTEAGATVNCSGPSGETPLALALYRECDDIVEYLKQYSDPLQENGRELLHAAQIENSRQIRSLLEEGADLEFEDANGNTALSWACLNFHKSVVAMLLENGANPNHVAKNGLTPIFGLFRSMTISFGRENNTISNETDIANMIEMLCKAGADVNHKSQLGTPLNRAIGEWNVAAIKTISRYGGGLGGQFIFKGSMPEHYYEDTALALLSHECNHAFYEMIPLCSEGLDTLFGDWAGEPYTGINFLHYAIQLGNKEAVEYLVTECGMPADSENFEKTTPLMYAIFCKEFDIADFLISQGASLSAMDIYELTPIDFVFRDDDQEKIDWYRKKVLPVMPAYSYLDFAFAALVCLQEIKSAPKAMEVLHSEKPEEDIEALISDASYSLYATLKESNYKAPSVEAGCGENAESEKMSTLMEKLSTNRRKKFAPYYCIVKCLVEAEKVSSDYAFSHIQNALYATASIYSIRATINELPGAFPDIPISEAEDAIQRRSV